MSYRLAADGVLLLHLAFVVFALLGGLLVLRWPWLATLHLPAAAWATFIELSGRLCPLTGLENSLRERAGDAGYAGGFVEHYLLPVLYPAGLTREVQLALAGVVVAVNAAVYVAVIWRRRRAAN